MSSLAIPGGTTSSAASTSSASSTASSSSTSITILQGGHSNSVLSLALNFDGSLLASGGEDGYLCLWLTSDNRLLKRRAVVHSTAPRTTPRGRHGTTAPPQPLSTSINHVVFANRPENQNRLFMACGPCLYEVDVARFESSDGPFEARLIAQHEDDVNQIALNDTESLLAACDDNGFVKVIEVDARPPTGDGATASAQSVRGSKVIMSVKKHANICSSLCFRRCSRKEDADNGDSPNVPLGALSELANSNAHATPSVPVNGFKWQLISGGMDCKLQLVEFQRKGRSVNIFDMNEFTEQDSAPFVLNPPFIHTVAITPDGGVVACGLENGNIELFDARRKNLTHLQTLYGHTQAVVKVLFVPPMTGEGNEESEGNGEERINYLVSAGNDGNIFCWELRDAGLDVHGATANGGHAHNGHNTQREGITIKVINCVEHWHKINWIEAKSLDKVYVGDQSTQIALCSLLP